MTNKIKSISLEQRQAAFWFLVGVSIVSLFVYFYAINSIARSTAMRQNLEAVLTDASSEIGALEFSYIELKNGVTAELAASYGFEEAKKPLYVSRSTSNSLTLNTRAR